MEIKRGGFIFKVAYGLKRRNYVDTETTLCKLFWRFLIMLFIGWPIAGIALGVLGLIVGIVHGISFLGGFWFARRPTIFKGEYESRNTLTMPYKKWPTFRGLRIYPIWIVMLAFVIVNYPHVTKAVIAAVTGVVLSRYFLWTIAITATTIILIIAVVSTSRMVRKSETFRMFREFLKAKKQKVCPIIKIVE